MRNSQAIENLQHKDRIQDFAIFSMQKEIKKLQEQVEALNTVLSGNILSGLQSFEMEENALEEVEVEPDDESIEAVFKRFNWDLESESFHESK